MKISLNLDPKLKKRPEGRFFNQTTSYRIILITISSLYNLEAVSCTKFNNW